MDRQQLEVAAPQVVNDKIELGNQVAKGSGGRNHRISGLVQFGDRVLLIGCQLQVGFFAGAELADKGIVNDIGPAGFGR